MRSCLRVPRLFLPEEGGFENWCSSPDSPVGDKRETFAARDCIYADGDPSDDESFDRLRERMYTVLSAGTITRLFRGMALVKRTSRFGVRKGLLAAVDLGEYAPAGSDTAMLRPLAEVEASAVETRARARAHALFELPHAVLCYRDKRQKILRALGEEELERLYDFTPSAGERLEGFFIPDDVSAEVIEDLYRCADPCFGVLDGHHELAAAKRHWETVRASLSEHDASCHPARFALAEFVDLTDSAVAVTSSGQPVRKEELLSHLKAGKLYPAHSLRLCAPRLLMEAREISYD